MESTTPRLSTLDVQLVPVLILWGRSPDTQDSVLKALFSETWRPPGAWRQLLAILLHGRNVLVRYNAPILLRNLLQGGLDEEQALRKLSRILRVHFRRQRQMAIGPDLSHRNTQVDAVLAGEQVRAAIRSEAETQGIPLGEAQARAVNFALEIASDYSYGVLRALELFLSWLWTRLYDGIQLHHFDVVTRIASGHEIVYVPCHRSHIDYLLLSYIIVRQGLTPPHIVRGAHLLHLAVVYQHHPVGHFQSFFLIVGNKHAGDVHFVVQPAQPAAQFLAHLGIECAEGFVEQQDGRLDGQGPSERDALTLAA